MVFVSWVVTAESSLISQSLILNVPGSRNADPLSRVHCCLTSMTGALVTWPLNFIVWRVIHSFIMVSLIPYNRRRLYYRSSSKIREHILKNVRCSTVSTTNNLPPSLDGGTIGVLVKVVHEAISRTSAPTCPQWRGDATVCRVLDVVFTFRLSRLGLAPKTKFWPNCADRNDISAVAIKCNVNRNTADALWLPSCAQHALRIANCSFRYTALCLWNNFVILCVFLISQTPVYHTPLT